jgi:hypothetical protein
MDRSKVHGAGKVMVWCGIWGNKIVRPVFFDTNLHAEMYLNMLQGKITPSLLKEVREFPAYFSKTARPCYGIYVCWWLDQQFPRSWIGRGPAEWPLRSPNLSPLDFYLWGHLKAMVYQEKIPNMNHRMECT